jgi:hypothetical protein
LGTRIFTAYTSAVRSSRVWMGVGVNSASEEIQSMRPGSVAIFPSPAST